MSSQHPAATVFDTEAGRYDASHDARSPEGYALRSRLGVVLGLIEGRAGDALDAGMGPGRVCAELHRRGFRVSGIDASDQMVALARERIPEARERLLRGEIESIPFPDASFDLVVATGVLEYVDYSHAALSELSRVTRPGGMAVVSAPNVLSPYALWSNFVFYPLIRLVKRFIPRGRPAPVRRPAPPARSRITGLLGSAGLEVESVAPSSYLVPPHPFEELFPEMTVRLAEQVEGGPRRLRSILATQFVFAARKPSGR